MAQGVDEKLKRIKLLILDVDGVLTDGKIVYNDRGEETKAFNVKDGLGIRLLIDAGIPVAVITGRRSEALRHRCKDLGITIIFQGVSDKVSALHDILKQVRVNGEETVVIGDDLPDIPLMKASGYAVAVADAPDIVKQRADKTTSAAGGCGAVREVSEIILKAQGSWDDLIRKWVD